MRVSYRPNINCSTCVMWEMGAQNNSHVNAVYKSESNECNKHIYQLALVSLRVRFKLSRVVIRHEVQIPERAYLKEGTKIAKWIIKSLYNVS